jgi:predicted RNase H-like HicB family nuclease
MKSIIQFIVHKGEKQYVAQGIELAIVTQGKTLDELTHNIQEAVNLHLEGENLADLGLVKRPAVLMNFELPQLVHA